MRLVVQQLRRAAGCRMEAQEDLPAAGRDKSSSSPRFQNAECGAKIKVREFCIELFAFAQH
jgi:hypothetical protein